MMTDLEILSAFEEAAKGVIEQLMEKVVPRYDDNQALAYIRLKAIDEVRERVTGMISLAWSTGWEMGWETGQKELMGNGSSEPDPEVIEEMKRNLERAKKDAGVEK